MGTSQVRAAIADFNYTGSRSSIPGPRSLRSEEPTENYSRFARVVSDATQFILEPVIYEYTRTRVCIYSSATIPSARKLNGNVFRERGQSIGTSGQHERNCGGDVLKESIEYFEF